MPDKNATKKQAAEKADPVAALAARVAVLEAELSHVKYVVGAAVGVSFAAPAPQVNPIAENTVQGTGPGEYLAHEYDANLRPA